MHDLGTRRLVKVKVKVKIKILIYINWDYDLAFVYNKIMSRLFLPSLPFCLKAGNKTFQETPVSDW